MRNQLNQSMCDVLGSLPISGSPKGQLKHPHAVMQGSPRYRQWGHSVPVTLQVLTASADTYPAHDGELVLGEQPIGLVH